MMNRRRWLLGAAGVAVVGAAGAGAWRWVAASQVAAGSFEIERSAEEWRRLLTPAQFGVLRKHGTEQPFSSPLDAEKREGTYACAGCDLPLYASETKFESGTGWPSFYAPLPDAIGASEDYTMLIKRTEVHCRRCGGHLGHVFEDGPPPTGLRYCMNGVAMVFHPATPQTS
jgi:peptide-methionine (R)-S-oxide reductase